MLLLALGIGVNTAIFSLVDAVLLRSLPVERPRELFFLRSHGPGGTGVAPPYPVFQRFRSEAPSFTGMAAFAADELRVDVDGTLEQMFGQVASGSYFDVLGLRPAAGRLLTGDDERLDPPAAVIGYGYWQRRFGGAASAIGRPITFGTRVYTIVGVAPEGFYGLHPGRRVDLTLPITGSDGVGNPGAWWFDVVARLGPDASVPRAALEVEAVFRSYMTDGSPATRVRRNVNRMTLVPAGGGLDGLRSRLAGPLLALTVMSALVLIVACVNLGNLLLVRGAARTREFAVRLATGAGAARLLRQLLTETLVLFVLGSAAGLAVAQVARTLAAFFAIGRNPILLDVQYNWRVAGFALGLALASGLLTGLWPAVRALRTNAQDALKDGRTPGQGRLGLAGRLLVASQAALSLVLLVVAVLFARTIGNLQRVDLGFVPSRVLTMSLDAGREVNADASRQMRFWSAALDRVRRLPGVSGASVSVLTPLSGRDSSLPVAVPGFLPRVPEDQVVRVNHVSDDYLRTFGISLIRGREFTPLDTVDAPRVALLNEAAAQMYFAGRDAVGATLDLGRAGTYRIVGVVADYKHRNVREPAPRMVLVPVSQPLFGLSRITLAIESDQPAAAVVPAVTAAITAVEPRTLISDVIAAPEQVAATLVTERLLSTLAVAFAALAVSLAAVGLYGVLSYSVARRRVEFGVRMAVGASPSRVAAGVLRDAVVQVAAGLAIGVPLALVAASAARRLLFGVAPWSPGIYVVGVTLLLVTAAAAGWLPARRACAEGAQAFRE